MITVMLLVTTCTAGECTDSIVDVWASETMTEARADMRVCERTVSGIATASGLEIQAQCLYGLE